MFWWEQPGLDGVAHQGGARVDAEPGIDAVKVGRHSARADNQPLGDFGGGQILGDQPDNFEFAGAEQRRAF